jgi:hypothetical protein
MSAATIPTDTPPLPSLAHAEPVEASAKPRRAPRHTEWTREKMVLFLRELAATQSVAYAAKSVGMSRTSAYNLRNRLQGSPFALGWEVALEMGMHQLTHAVMDRALNGVEVQRFYHGELVASTTVFDNRLAQWVLENPWRVGRHQIAREYSGQTFDALLERIETASLRWEEGEAVPGPGWPYLEPEEADAEESQFLRKQSWYADDAGEAPQRRSKPGW